MRSVIPLVFSVSAIVAVAAEAHFGDRVFPIPEVTDEMLAEIDFNDGLVEDWIGVVGEPVLTPVDFVLTREASGGQGIQAGLINNPGQFNAADLSFRIWLGWHDGSDKMLVAGQFADDGFKETESLEGVFDPEVDRFWFAVDGDHSGPPYINFSEAKLHITSQVRISVKITTGSGLKLPRIRSAATLVV